jgi:competence protein ComEA
MLSNLRRSLPAIAGTSVFWIAVLGAVLLYGLRRPPPQPIQIVPPAEVTAPAPAPATAASPTPGQVRVYVSGAVAQPGVYRLAPDSLVQDAVNAAGGAAAEADLVAINLAHSLADGEQIYVPKTGEVSAPVPGAKRSSSLAPDPGASAGASADATADAPIDLNLATEAQLEALPGIGPKMTAAIIEGRPYGSVDDLLRVKGIGEVTLAKLRPFVKVE